MSNSLPEEPLSGAQELGAVHGSVLPSLISFAHDVMLVSEDTNLEPEEKAVRTQARIQDFRDEIAALQERERMARSVALTDLNEIRARLEARMKENHEAASAAIDEGNFSPQEIAARRLTLFYKAGEPATFEKQGDDDNDEAVS